MTRSLARRPKGISLTFRLLAIALALGGLAGCAQIGVIYNTQRYLSGTELYVTHAAGSKMQAVIRGNPSTLAKADFDRIVRDDMKGANFGRPITFVAGPDNPPFDDSRIVLILNGPVFGQAELCNSSIPAGGGVAPDGRIEVLAAFCSGGRPVSALAGGISGVTDPNDPKFRDFLREVGMVLFNPNNPEDNPDHDIGPPIP
jgi:hypothetical protein